MTIVLTMANGEQHELTHHGSRKNEERWCISYLKDADIIGAYVKDEDSGSVQCDIS